MKKWVEENNVIVLKGDKSKDSPEVDQLLIELGNPTKAIPYYALMRPDAPALHFNGVYLTPASFIERISIDGVGGNIADGAANVADETRNVVDDREMPNSDRISQLPPMPGT